MLNEVSSCGKACYRDSLFFDVKCFSCVCVTDPKSSLGEPLPDLSLHISSPPLPTLECCRFAPGGRPYSLFLAVLSSWHLIALVSSRQQDSRLRQQQSGRGLAARGEKDVHVESVSEGEGEGEEGAERKRTEDKARDGDGLGERL